MYRKVPPNELAIKEDMSPASDHTGRRPLTSLPTLPADWLVETITRMLGCVDLTALVTLADDVIRGTLGYDRLGLLLLNEADDSLVEHISTDKYGHRFYPVGRIFARSSNHQVFAVLAHPLMMTQGYMFISDVDHQIPASYHPQLDGAPRELLRVALRLDKRVLGFISVDNLVSGRPLHGADFLDLVTFTDALSLAIATVRQRDRQTHEIQTLNTSLRRRIDYLSWLGQAITQLAVPTGIDETCQIIYNAVRTGLGYDRAAVLLIEADLDGRLHDREVIGTDEHGNPIPGTSSHTYLDQPDLAEIAPDLAHFLQGGDYYYTSNRWVETPDRERAALHGEMAEQLVVALRNSDRAVIGYISVDNLPSKRPISPDEAQPLVTFAAQAAQAISRARLWVDHLEQGARLRRRLADLEWLRQVTTTINAAQSLATVVDTVYDGIRDGLGYDRVGIGLCDHEHQTLSIVVGTDADGTKLATPNLVLSLAPDSPVWTIPGMKELWEGANYHINPNVQETTPPLGQEIYQGVPHEALLLPLRSGNRITGMISIDNLPSGRPLSWDPDSPLLSLINQVGISLENARLREREAQERARLEVLFESSRAVNSSLERDDIFRAMSQSLTAAIGASHVCVLSSTQPNNSLTLMQSYAIPECQPIDHDIDQSGTAETSAFLHDLVERGIPVVMNRDDPHTPLWLRAFLDDHGVRHAVLCPFGARRQAVGLLTAFWNTPVAITPDILALCAAIADIAAVALQNAQLYADAAHRADHDPLTGLLNHRALLQEIDRALVPLEQKEGDGSLPDAHTSCSLLMIDVDNFKLFNDIYGHPTGDAVLAQVATLIQQTCRAQDMAGRFGGDEFALLLPGATYAQALSVADRLRATVGAQPHVAHDGSYISLSLSIGVATAPTDGRTRKEIVAMADARMYDHKRHGPPGQGNIVLPFPHTSSTAATGGPYLQRRASDLLGDSPFSVLEGLVLAVNNKDRYTRVHSDDVVRLALRLADDLSLDAEDRRVLAVAAALHDVGKIAMPDRILRKPGRLTTHEYTHMKEHVRYGVAIIRGVLDDDASVLRTVLAHHERWDGAGYPNKVPGAATPLTGRILHIVDAMSAMTLERSYRARLSWAEVRRELERGAGTQFDPDLVGHVLEHWSEI